MKLELVSGQENASVGTIFHNILADNGYDECNAPERNFMIFPERTIHHPKTLYNSIRKRVRDHIESDSDLFILTYSDHVLNAVRVEVLHHKFEGAKVHQVTSEGIDVIANIETSGAMSEWVSGIFDIWDDALDELLLLKDIV